MGWTEKVAITLPKEDIRRLRKVTAKQKIPFSAGVREAVRTWLKILENEEIQELYRRYYADPKNYAEDEALTRQVAKLGAQHWPAD